MWPDRVSNSGPLTYESGALPTVLRSLASRGDSFDPKFMNFCQNVNHHEIWIMFETGSCLVKS